MKLSLAYELLSPVRQQLVLSLKKRGQSDMESLATEQFLSLGAVRQNLSALTAQGVVAYGVERTGPGRPRHVYYLTSLGQRIFPDFYGEVANALLTAVEEEGPELLERILDRASEVMFEGLSERVEGKRPDQRVREVIKVLDEYGYLPETRQVDPDTYEVVINHCPISAVARRHPSSCHFELRCMQFAAGSAEVTRTEHPVAGDRACKFIFRQN